MHSAHTFSACTHANPLHFWSLQANVQAVEQVLRDTAGIIRAAKVGEAGRPALLERDVLL